jgi:hypothetical protein
LPYWEFGCTRGLFVIKAHKAATAVIVDIATKIVGQVGNHLIKANLQEYCLEAANRLILIAVGSPEVPLFGIISIK